MKKQLFLGMISSMIITFSDCHIQQLNTSVDEKYESAMRQLQKHLDAAHLTPPERNSLINKLIGYFSNNQSKMGIHLGKCAQLIYCSVIKSYNEILSAQKGNGTNSSNKAKMFSEQALGKILLSKKFNQNGIKKTIIKKS